MTLTINISPEKEAAYQALAQAQGLSVEQWLTQLVDQGAPVAPLAVNRGVRPDKPPKIRKPSRVDACAVATKPAAPAS